MSNKPMIGYRIWDIRKPWLISYICSLPCKGKVDCADYGYTSKVKDALPLNTYWQKRFRKHCSIVSGYGGLANSDTGMIEIRF